MAACTVTERDRERERTQNEKLTDITIVITHIQQHLTSIVKSLHNYSHKQQHIKSNKNCFFFFLFF